MTRFAPRDPATLTDDQQRMLRAGSRRDVEGWVLLHLEGAPRDRGFAHGWLLAPELADALRVIRQLLVFDTGADLAWFGQAAVEMWHDKLPDELEAELRGILEGAQAAGVAITWPELLAWNGYPELICQWWPLPDKTYPKARPPGPHHGHAVVARRGLGRRTPHHCSAFVATGSYTADGGIVAAHTTWQRFANGDAYNVIIDLRPDQGQRVLMQSVPGYIASSTDFGFNGAGLVVTETSLNASGFDEDGTPEFVRARIAQQYATTIDEWVELFLRGNNGGYAGGWLLAETGTGRIGRCEVTIHATLDDPPLAIQQDGHFTGFNLAWDPVVRNRYCSDPGAWSDVLDSGARRVRFAALMEQLKGRLDASLARRVIADHHDVYLDAADHPCSRTICGHLDDDDGRFGGGGQGPWYPWGSLDGKAVDTSLVANRQLDVRWGRACGRPLDVRAFLAAHPQYDWLDGLMKDRPARPWTTVAGR